MIKREFKAKIVDDFENAWLNAICDEEKMTMENAIKYYLGDELKQLSNRISGKFVMICEHEYEVGTNDYFEKVDNNYVIYPSLFSEVITF